MKSNGFDFIDHSPTKSPSTSTVCATKNKFMYIYIYLSRIRSQIFSAPFGALRWTRLHYPTNFVMASLIFKLVWCIAVMLKQDFWWILLHLNSFEALSEFFQRPDLGVEGDWLPSRHRIHNSHFCTVPENSGRAVSSWQRIFELLCFFCFGNRHSFHVGTYALLLTAIPFSYVLLILCNTFLNLFFDSI